MELPIKVGDYIQKPGHDVFRLKGKEWSPAVEVLTIRRSNKKKNLIVNDELIFRRNNEFKIITKEEAERLNNLFTSLKLVETECKTIEETCFTSHTGERKEKQKYNTVFGAKRALFYLLERYKIPVQMYKCPNCEFYHIGKIQEKESINT